MRLPVILALLLAFGASTCRADSKDDEPDWMRVPKVEGEARVFSPEQAAGMRGDAAGFEAYTLFHLKRRGVPRRLLTPAFSAHLHDVVAKAAADAPEELSEYPLVAADVGEADVTRLFAILRDEPEGLSDFIREMVRRKPLPPPPEGAAAKAPARPIPADILARWRAHRSVFEGLTLADILARMDEKARADEAPLPRAALAAPRPVALGDLLPRRP